jgi:ABC-type phosphate/phosphonate transport system substrate-binding protein
LTAHTGVTLERMLFNGANGLLSALRQGEVDVVLCSQTMHTSAQQQGLGEVLLTPVVEGKSEERYCLVVRDDNVFTALAQLNGRRLGYITWDSLDLLKPQFQMTTQDFREKRQLKYSRDAIVALQLHEVDAVLASEHLVKVFRKMSLKQTQPIGIKVLAYSQPFANSPLLIRKHLSPSKYAKILKLKAVLLNLRQDTEARKIFGFFDIDGWLNAP